jgi:hypothetical protein
LYFEFPICVGLTTCSTAERLEPILQERIAGMCIGFSKKQSGPPFGNDTRADHKPRAFSCYNAIRRSKRMSSRIPGELEFI